ncbi:hypothetical protein, conserved [Plasmodium gonderi]|uniref:Uncharacterized protein n=1 Tax=Plasmodium gonderi TaxID=77519 RepID=A0A1Y1JMJ3_PLAGO|nr:hypothetical protein, conserved [Plasmodium gonderi]GAW82062.1 hypothetical protein, conserved [Plasmodium gonderi]
MSEQCVLIPGEFGVFVQLFIGFVSMGILLTKYAFEKPRRTFIKFLKDVIVIICGSIVLHMTNIFTCIFISRYHILSYLYKIDMDECSIYFIQIIIDATLGLYVEYKLFALFKFMKFRKEYLYNNSTPTIYKPVDALSHYSSFINFSNNKDEKKLKDHKNISNNKINQNFHPNSLSLNNEHIEQKNSNASNINQSKNISTQSDSNNLETFNISNTYTTDNALYNFASQESIGNQLITSHSATEKTLEIGSTRTNEINNISKYQEGVVRKGDKFHETHKCDTYEKEDENVNNDIDIDNISAKRNEHNTYEECNQYDKYKKYYNSNSQDYKNELKLLTDETPNEEVCIQLNENNENNKETTVIYENKNSDMYKKIEESYMDLDLFQNILIWLSVVITAKCISFLIFFLFSPFFNMFVLGTIANITDMRYKLLVVMVILPFCFNFIIYFYTDSIVKSKHTCRSVNNDKI